MPRTKVGIVGAGNVGASAALMLLKKDLCDVVLCDIPQVDGMPQGKALDMSESRQVDHHDAKASGTTSVDDLKDCDIVVITAGLPRKPGMTREDVVKIIAARGDYGHPDDIRQELSARQQAEIRIAAAQKT